MKRLLLALLCFPFFCFGQLVDDFSDGNFTTNPAWVGETDSWDIDNDQLKSADTVASNSFYLSTPSISIDSTQWQFYCNIKFNPSGNNFIDVFLTSNLANLEASPNGYFVRIGNSDDEVSLYRNDAGTDVLLIDGTDDKVDFSNNTLVVRVTRDNFGLWNLEVDYGVTGLFVLEGSATDLLYTTSAHFGILVKQSTASFFKKHYFDDFYVGPIVGDTLPPSISNVSVISDTEIDVHFSETVEILSSETQANYSANNSIGTPSSATRSLTDSTVVRLVFATNFGNGIVNTLSVSNVSDNTGNAISVAETADFIYLVPDVSAVYDVLIHEIFPNPTPSFGLPEYEFVELYNASSKVLDLAGFTLSDGTNTGVLPSQPFIPGAFLILCDEEDTSSFLPYGPVVGLDSWPSLNNSGDQLVLKDNNGSIVHELIYSDTWYNDEFKEDGGWTLEMVDPGNPCAESGNWQASNNTSGGTPGIQNSVHGVNPDTESPKVLRADAIGPDHVLLTFSEPLDSTGLANITYVIDHGIVVTTDSVISSRTIQATLTPSLQSGVLYTIEISNFSDCVGNLVESENSAQFALPEPAEPGDLIINEVLCNPRESGSDFVEIYNKSARYINIQGWRLANVDNGIIDNYQVISDQSRIVFPDEYVLLSTDTANVLDEYPLAATQSFLQMLSTPTYSNDSGTVVLISDQLLVSDSFAYNESMHFSLLNDLNGVSLERLDFGRETNDKTNWHSAAEAVGFATPGYKNSQYSIAQTGDEVTISPEIFSPDNDAVDDVVNIAYKFDAPGFVGTVTIYDSKGRLVKKLVQNDLLGSEGVFSWDGENEDYQKARMGIYVVFFEAFGVGGEVKQIKKTCVLGGRL